MATDYDAPRTTAEDEAANESLDTIRAQRSTPAQDPVLDVDDTDTAEGVDLPGADLSGEELLIQVVPEQDDEFICNSCFLVHHRSQMARQSNGATYCTDCED